jgi:putative flippase GtrA
VYLRQPNWEIGATLSLVAIGFVIFAALRHKSHPLIRVTVAAVVIGVFIAFVWRPIWDDFSKEHPRLAKAAPDHIEA